MSGSASIDLRYPLGGLLATLGVLLAGYGLVTRSDPAMYARSYGINVNLWWGVVMIFFGLVFLARARKG